MQQPQLFVPCGAVFFYARVVHDPRGIQAVQHRVEFGESVGEFHGKGGECGKAFFVIAPFQPFFGVFFTVDARVLHFHAQLARDFVDGVRLFFAAGEIFARLSLRMGTLFVRFRHECVKRCKRSFSEGFRAGRHGAFLHAERGPFFEESVVVLLRSPVDAEQGEQAGKFLFARVEIGKVGFHLFVCKLVLANKFFRLVQNMRAGELFAVLFRAVFRDEQKGLLFHGIVFKEFEDALHFIGLEIFLGALQDLIEFAVERRVFFGTDGFRASDGGVYGEIFHKERIAREDADEVAFFPESKNFNEPLFGDLEEPGAGRRIEISRHLAKIQPVEVDADGIAVRLRQILCDELIFDAGEHIRAEILGKGGERHKNFSRVSLLRFPECGGERLHFSERRCIIVYHKLRAKAMAFRSPHGFFRLSFFS